MGWLARIRDKIASLGGAARSAIGRVFSRVITVWSNTPARFETMGQVQDRQDNWYQWQLGATERHCKDCLHLNGQIHRASEWRGGIMPQSMDLECGGWNCDCRLVILPNYEGEGEGTL